MKNVVIDAIEIATERERQNAADETARRREVEANYAALLMRTDRPEDGDVRELSHCIEALKLGVDDVRGDQAAIDEFRRQLALDARRSEATQAVFAANEARQAMLKRHEKEIEEATRLCVRARREAGECSISKSAMANLEIKHPRLLAAFAVMRNG